MTSPNIAAIILAAGRSTRMGQCKPLLPLGEHTIIERIIDLFVESKARDVYVVVGHDKARIVPVLERTPVRVVENNAYDQGMFSSIKAGVERINPARDAFFILPADIPLVRPHTLELLVCAYGDCPGKIVHPLFRGRRGHPPLIPTEYIPGILGWENAGGLKTYFADQDHHTVEVVVPDRHILFDVDTPQAYTELIHRWDRYTVPTREECEIIMSSVYPVAGRTKQHGHHVARVAEHIADALVRTGIALDQDLIRAGALLHDLAKGQKDHAEIAGELLTRMGYARLGHIVGAHTDLKIRSENPISETEVVYLADKLVKGDRRIPLARRFEEPLHRWAHDAAAVERIMERRDTAYLVKQRIEKRIDCSVETLLDACS